MLEVTPVPAFRDNYIWIIGTNDTRSVAIVDPGDARPVLEMLDSTGLKPCAILATHHHADHVGGVTDLLSRFDIPVFGPAGESIPGRSTALKEGDAVDIPELSAHFRILDVPGHTAGHIAYYGHDMLFIGDTLFMCGCGRLFEGTAPQMYDSLGKIMGLPETTQIYCAHEYTLANIRFALQVEPDNTALQQRYEECRRLRDDDMPTVPGTLAVELATNPFLRAEVPAVRAAARRHAGGDCDAPVEVFAAVRSWKDGF